MRGCLDTIVFDGGVVVDEFVIVAFFLGVVIRLILRIMRPISSDK